MASNLTATDKKAILEFGKEMCVNAFQTYEKTGNGANTIAFDLLGSGYYKKHSQYTYAGDRMINAGRKLKI